MHTLILALATIAVGCLLGTALHLLVKKRWPLHLEIATELAVSPLPEDTKPLEATITDLDGQWHTFRLGAGDGLAYAGIRIDVITDTRISLSHHTHDGAEHFIQTTIE